MCRRSRKPRATLLANEPIDDGQPVEPQRLVPGPQHRVGDREMQPQFKHGDGAAGHSAKAGQAESAQCIRNALEPLPLPPKKRDRQKCRDQPVQNERSCGVDPSTDRECHESGNGRACNDQPYGQRAETLRDRRSIRRGVI